MLLRRNLILIVALAALLWQGVAGVSLSVLGKAASDAAHAALHWKDVGHHHHADGALHADASPASIEHVALDGSHVVASSFALPSLSFALPPTELPRYWSEHLPNPYPKPLQRPPQTLS